MGVLRQLRHRAVAAVTVVALSALLVGCATFAVLYEATLEEALLTDSLTRAGVVSNALQWQVGDDGNGPLPLFDVTMAGVETPVTHVYPGLSPRWHLQTRVSLAHGDAAVLTVVATPDVCRGLSVATGHCPTNNRQILVSQTAAARENWQVGTTVEIARATSDEVAQAEVAAEKPQRVTVVGTYRQLPDDTWWLGQRLTGKTGQEVTTGRGEKALGTDDWVTTVETLPYLGRPTLTVAGPLDRSRLTLDNLNDAAAAIDRLQQKDRAVSDLPSIAAAVGLGRSQAAVVVPLLMAQLGVFALTMLVTVLGAYLGLRRPDIAVARLRGSTPGHTARWVWRELALLCVAGAPIGHLAATGVVGLVVSTALVPGTTAVHPRWAVLPGLAALVVEVVAAAWVVRSHTRQPILDLLRRMPRLGRRVWRPTRLETTIAAVALAGLVTVAGGGAGQGAVSLATPTLLALVVGLTVARVATATAASWGRRRLEGGHLTSGLAAVQLGRRPAARATLTALTVATALSVFATDASAVAARNRDDLARLRSGAEVSLVTDAVDPTVFRDTVVAFDEGRGIATPVGVVTQPSSPVTTLAVLPDRIGAVALRPSTDPPYDLSAIAPILTVPRATGSRATVTLRTSGAAVQVEPPERGKPPVADPSPARVLRSTRLYLHTLDWLGNRNVIQVDALPAPDSPSSSRTVRAYCENGCVVTGIDLDTADDVPFVALRGRLLLTVRIGDQEVDLAQTPWRDNTVTVTTPGRPQTEVTIGPQVSPGAGFPVQYVLSAMTTAKLADPRGAFFVPAVRAGPPQGSNEHEDAAGLDGTPLTMKPVATLAQFPGGAELTAVVNYDNLTALSNAKGDRTWLQVWLTTPSSVPAVTDALARRGIQVLSRTDRAEVLAGLDSSASAWGLRLAVVLGGGAVLLAALGMVVQAAGAGPDRARERSTLRLVGVGDRTLRRAYALEQLVSLGGAALWGLGAGMAGAWLALPQIPLFQVPSAPLTPSWATDWSAVLVAAAAATTTFALVAVVAARRLRRAATTTLAVTGS